MTRHTVVVGGGIVGAFCAWYLLKTGRSVTIVEADRFSSGCSHGNCGFICPSHVFPLPAPGQIRRIFRGMLQRHTPLRIPLRWSPSLWLWLLRFAWHCNRRHMRRAGAARHQLLQSSMTEYRNLAECGELIPEWHDCGLLFVCRDDSTMTELLQTSDVLRRDYQLTSRHLTANELCELEPGLRPGLAGAIWFDGDAHVRPDRVMSSLKSALRSQGAVIEEGFRVSSIASAGNTATAVCSEDDREIAADEFVVATGALTPFLNHALGCRIPIQPGKGYSITMAKTDRCPRYPMILEECHVALTPFDTGFRIGSTMEFSGYNSKLNRGRLQYLRDGAAEYLCEPIDEHTEEEWFGWRPMTSDGLPYIDRTSRYSNVWLAAGHNMIGLSTAPATGRLVSELIAGMKPHVDPEPFRIR